MKIRRFVAKIDKFGSDDGGVASFVVKAKAITKDKIYTEHMRLVVNRPNVSIKKPTGYVIDDNGCWHMIGTDSFKSVFKEIVG